MKVKIIRPVFRRFQVNPKSHSSSHPPSLERQVKYTGKVEKQNLAWGMLSFPFWLSVLRTPSVLRLSVNPAYHLVLLSLWYLMTLTYTYLLK